MRVFYSHPMKLYGTAAERRELSQIRARFPGAEVVDPSADPGMKEERYLALVDACDALVFSRHFGNVTQGVKPEVERALSAGKPVYEVRDGRIEPVTGPVSDLPMGKRLALRAKAALGRGR
ncbi:MAG: hypothetical protein JRN03_01855 [Nitrososphaerota archaeon]|nr:hypothetical protein [Nitrososphaerota archaeon]